MEPQIKDQLIFLNSSKIFEEIKEVDEENISSEKNSNKLPHSLSPKNKTSSKYSELKSKMSTSEPDQRIDQSFEAFPMNNFSEKNELPGWKSDRPSTNVKNVNVHLLPLSKNNKRSENIQNLVYLNEENTKNRKSSEEKRKHLNTSKLEIFPFSLEKSSFLTNGQTLNKKLINSSFPDMNQDITEKEVLIQKDLNIKNVKIHHDFESKLNLDKNSLSLSKINLNSFKHPIVFKKEQINRKQSHSLFSVVPKTPSRKNSQLNIKLDFSTLSSKPATELKSGQYSLRSKWSLDYLNGVPRRNKLV